MQVIVQEKDEERIADWTFRETAAREVYVHHVKHKGKAVSWKEVETPYGKVRIKDSVGPNFTPNMKIAKIDPWKRKSPFKKFIAKPLQI